MGDVDYVVDGPHITPTEDAVRERSQTSITGKIDPHINASRSHAAAEPS